MKRLFGFLFLFLFMAATAEATTYYVGQGGGDSDSNSCTSAQVNSDGSRKLTIQGGASCATSPGDIVTVKAGTYTAGLSNPTSGTAVGGYITYQCEAIRTCIIQAGKVTDAIAFMTGNRRYIAIIGFKIDGQSNATTICIHGSGAAAGTHGPFKFEDNEITGCVQGFQISGTDSAEVRRNWVHDISVGSGSNQNHCIYSSSYNRNWIIENNLLDNCSGYGVHIYSTGAAIPTGHTVRYNIAKNMATRSGMVFYGTGHSAYNNLILNNPQSGIRAVGAVSLYNNTLYNNTAGIDGSSGICRNNIILSSNSTAGCATSSGNLTSGNPTDIFIDPSGGNFNLKESSVAIDGGTAISGFSDGRYVGSAPDQGAFEAPIRLNAAVEDATDTIYRIRFSLPIQSTRNNVGLQTCTVGNIAIVVAGSGATESSCTTTSLASRVDVTLGAAVTVGQSLTDAYTRSAAPTLMDNVAIGDPNGTLGTHYFNAQVRTYSAASGTNNVDGGALPALTQSRFRFHHLRGTEAAPTLICTTCTENVNMELPRGAAFRLRVKFRTDDDPAGTTYKLRVSKDGGAYGDIPDVMDTGYIAWYGVSGGSDIPAAGTATTELLTSDEASNTVCAVVRSSSDYPVIDLNNSETECEYALQTSMSAPLGTTWDFRVYRGDNTALDTYTVTPRLTAGVFVMGF